MAGDCPRGYLQGQCESAAGSVRLDRTTSKLVVMGVLTGQGPEQAEFESPPKASVTTGRDRLSLGGRRGMWNRMDTHSTRLPPLLQQLPRKTVVAIQAMRLQAEVSAVLVKPSRAASGPEMKRRRARRFAWVWTASVAVGRRWKTGWRWPDPATGAACGPWRELNEYEQ